MFETLKSKIYQKNQYISDIKNAVIHEKFKGFPILKQDLCKNCEKCTKICPANAIKLNPLSIDLGKCIFCGDCERVCTDGAIKFSNFHKLSSTNREKLIITSTTTIDDFITDAVVAKEKIKKIFPYDVMNNNNFAMIFTDLKKIRLYYLCNNF